MDVENYVK